MSTATGRWSPVLESLATFEPVTNRESFLLTLFSARVLNSDNRFDDENLIIHQMRRAIEVFFAPPYNCRVFNISLGADTAWFEHNDRQSLWAESLDILAREYNVCLVVSAGNHSRGVAFTADDAEEVVATFPDYLFQPECGLCEPATAAIPITVGGIAEHAAAAVPQPRRVDDLNRPIAEPLQPSPTTRIGPGINSAIKPASTILIPGNRMPAASRSFGRTGGPSDSRNHRMIKRLDLADDRQECSGMVQVTREYLTEQLELAEQLHRGKHSMLEPQDLPGRCAFFLLPLFRWSLIAKA